MGEQSAFEVLHSNFAVEWATVKHVSIWYFKSVNATRDSYPNACIFSLLGSGSICLLEEKWHLWM